MQPRSLGRFPSLGAGQAREKSLGTRLEKMTTIAPIIGLKGMPMGKTLAGSFSQPRDYRLKTTHITQCLYILLFSIANTRTIPNSIATHITLTDFTIFNACPGKSARCVPPFHKPSTSSPKVIQNRDWCRTSGMEPCASAQ